MLKKNDTIISLFWFWTVWTLVPSDETVKKKGWKTPNQSLDSAVLAWPWDWSLQVFCSSASGTEPCASLCNFSLRPEALLCIHITSLGEASKTRRCQQQQQQQHFAHTARDFQDQDLCRIFDLVKNTILDCLKVGKVLFECVFSEMLDLCYHHLLCSLWVKGTAVTLVVGVTVGKLEQKKSLRFSHFLSLMFLSVCDTQLPGCLSHLWRSPVVHGPNVFFGLCVFWLSLVSRSPFF